MSDDTRHFTWTVAAAVDWYSRHPREAMHLIEECQECDARGFIMGTVVGFNGAVTLRRCAHYNLVSAALSVRDDHSINDARVVEVLVSLARLQKGNA